MEENNRAVTGASGTPGETPPTGDEQVDEALTALQRLDELPVHDHPELFDAVHRVLQDRLAADDQTASSQDG